MLLNMSLYLSDSNKDKTIAAQIYHALAEAYFIGSEHERCIDAGKECFKLQPVKSEVFFFFFSESFQFFLITVCLDSQYSTEHCWESRINTFLVLTG